MSADLKTWIFVGALTFSCYNNHRLTLAINLWEVALLDQFAFTDVLHYRAHLYYSNRSGLFCVLQKSGPRKAEPHEIEADEARYYTKAWQEAEREATKAHKRGGLPAFDTVDELMDYIEAK